MFFSTIFCRKELLYCYRWHYHSQGYLKQTTCNATNKDVYKTGWSLYSSRVAFFGQLILSNHWDSVIYLKTFLRLLHVYLNDKIFVKKKLYMISLSIFVWRTWFLLKSNNGWFLSACLSQSQFFLLKLNCGFFCFLFLWLNVTNSNWTLKIV